MNWEELRSWCLSMPGAEETFPFEPGVAVFKAPNGKMFAVSVTTAEPLDI
jgi:predicted DNA-binding protein (MmcQ/YjbR family)